MACSLWTERSCLIEREGEKESETERKKGRELALS